MNFIGDSETDSMAFRVSLPVATIILMMLLTPFSGCLDNSGSTSDSSEDQDSEGSLRINHIQMKGTHNSYHVEPLVSPTREYMYTHEELDVRLPSSGSGSLRLMCGGISGTASGYITTSTTLALLALPLKIA